MNTIMLIKDCRQYVDTQGRLFFSRKKAKEMRDEIINDRGYSLVDKKTMREIKSYSKQRFGSQSFWPWLATYTEVRGDFQPGWIPDDYYSVVLLDRYNPENMRMSEYKTFDNKIFPDFIVKPLMLKIGNNFYDSDRIQITQNEAEDLLRDYDKEIVIKEDLGLGGSQVRFAESRTFDFKSMAQLSNYIIQPVVNQHEDLKRLGSKAVCTIRVFTYLNEDGSVDLKFAYLRFGIGESRVDNTKSGGGYCFVTASGNLAEMGYETRAEKIGNKHPDSGVLFNSITVPSYHKAIEKCTSSHKEFPYARFIGWDVAINEAGKPVLLEWNTDPGFWNAEALKGPFFPKDNFAENAA